MKSTISNKEHSAIDYSLGLVELDPPPFTVNSDMELQDSNKRIIYSLKDIEWV